MGNAPPANSTNVDVPPEAPPQDSHMSDSDNGVGSDTIAPHPPIPVATAVPVVTFASQASATPIQPATSEENNTKSEASSGSGSKSSAPEHGVSIDIIPEHSELAKGQAHETMVGIHLTAAEANDEDDESSRAPLDVVVVSDLSGSMSGEKLRQLKETIKLLGHELAKQDRVGLVTFESNVNEPLKLNANLHMTSAGRSQLDGLVDGYRTSGMTNLSGGLFAGIGQFPTTASSSTTKVLDVAAKVRTCLLLTDGQANRGVTATKEIVGVLESMLEQRNGLTVHTFGYGGDHNSEMLQAISEAANGSYYFIESTDEIRGAFGDCLGGLLTVVAQNIEVCIEAVGDAVITQVHDKAAVCEEAGKRYTMKFTDLYGEEERDLLVSLRLPKGSSGGDAVRATLQYVDVVQGKMSSASKACAIARPATVSPESKIPNEHITVHRTRIEVAQTIEEASGLADAGDLTSARDRLVTMQRKTAAMKAKSPEMALVSNFDDDLLNCLDSVADQRTYVTKGNHNMRNITSTHTKQRCQMSKSYQYDDEEDFAPLASARRQSRSSSRSTPSVSYQTSAKRKKAAKFKVGF